MGMSLAFGFSETDNGHVYDAAVWCDADGDTLAKHRRVHLGPDEAEIFTAGQGFGPLTTIFGPVGLTVSADAWAPEMADVIREHGGQALFSPTFCGDLADQHGALADAARHALLWIIAVNSVIPGHSRGGSVIINPQGEAVCTLSDEPDMACVDIELESTS
jgi:predicted amidohydrolase